MLWIMNEMRMKADEDFRVTDIRFNPLQITKVLLAELLPGTPINSLHREIMEMVSLYHSNCISYISYSIFLYHFFVIQLNFTLGSDNR